MTCGDTAAAWVGAGSIWSGVLDPDTDDAQAFTAVMLPTLLGTNIAATIILLESGAGTWVFDGSFRWTGSLAGVWDYRFEAVAVTCDGSGKVTYAEGGATDGLSVVHPFTLTRVS